MVSTHKLRLKTRKIFDCKCGARIDMETEDNKIKCLCCGKVVKIGEKNE